MSSTAENTLIALGTGWFLHWLLSKPATCTCEAPAPPAAQDCPPCQQETPEQVAALQRALADFRLAILDAFIEAKRQPQEPYVVPGDIVVTGILDDATLARYLSAVGVILAVGGGEFWSTIRRSRTDPEIRRAIVDAIAAKRHHQVFTG